LCDVGHGCSTIKQTCNTTQHGFNCIQLHMASTVAGVT
jgi:hypothetical protein